MFEERKKSYDILSVKKRFSLIDGTVFCFTGISEDGFLREIRVPAYRIIVTTMPGKVVVVRGLIFIKKVYVDELLLRSVYEKKSNFFNFMKGGF